MEHYCGIIGFADNLTNLYFIKALNKLQHRGQESAGVCYTDCSGMCMMHYHKNLGLVKEAFKNYQFKTQSLFAIGHVRYSTRKKTTLEMKIKESQPFMGTISNGQFSVAHNGNIPNIGRLVKEHGLIVETHSDTEVIVKYLEYLFLKYDQSWDDTLRAFINKIPGAYCLVILTKDALYGIRDNYGIRPLSIGHRNNNYCIASETVAFGNNYKFMRNVKPGEIIKIQLDRVNQLYTLNTIYQKRVAIPSVFCSFEYIYFMNHQSLKTSSRNMTVWNLRYKIGHIMGKKEQQTQNRIVVPVPNTAIPYAKGFADASKLPYREYLVKNKNMHRTFILPTEKERKTACDKKFIYLKDKLNGKNIYLLDDSIVRGTTMSTIINKLKQCGVNEIHLRITSPPIRSECYFGIDMSTKKELIAHNKSIEEIRIKLGATSLTYLDIDTMKKTFGENTCTSCFTNNGNYDKKLLDW